MEKDQIKLGKAEDISNQIFGYLQPLYRTNNIGKHTAWKCKCLRDGNLVNVRIDHLKEGRVISCGCYNSEKGKEHIKSINYKGKNMKDITGLKSGFLIALEPTEKRIHYGDNTSYVVWKCQCLNPLHKTPVYCEATTTDITTQNKTSCGCINSRGEAKILEWLIQNNIYFEQQKTFDSCRFPKSNYLAKFDFYLPKYNLIIEYNGKQHYAQDGSGWGESLKDIQSRDLYKQNWCKNNNIQMLIIPYWENNLEKLLIEKIQENLNEPTR